MHFRLNLIYYSYLCCQIAKTMNTSIDPSRIFTRQQVDDLLTAAINKTLLQVDKAQLFAHHDGRDKVEVMQTSTTYSQQSLRETLLLCTNRSHCFLCGLSFVSSSHRQPNALKSRTRYIAKDYTHARGWHLFSNSRASAPS